MTLAQTLAESQQNYQKGAVDFYRAIAETVGPFRINDGEQHHTYIRACVAVERAARGGKAKGPLSSLRTRKTWEAAFKKAIADATTNV